MRKAFQMAWGLGFAMLLPVSGAVGQDSSKAPKEPKTPRPAGVWYGTTDIPDKRDGALRLAAYNIENLFDRVDDPRLAGEQEDLTMATSESRLIALAEQIRRLDADVLCLEEVESEECLRWFRDTYLSDLGYAHLASLDAGYYRGVEQSVLSRLPITSASVYSGNDAVISDMEALRTPERAATLGGTWATAGGKPSEKFQRFPLRVTVTSPDGYELTAIVTHLKAGDFDHQRELEALQLEQLLGEMLKANPDANIAVVGDYNSTPGDMAAKVLRTSPLGLGNAYDWRFDTAAARETYTTHASGRVLDYILMSPALAADCIDKSFFVMGTLHAASDWDYKKAAEIPPPAGYASDHCPIAIDIDPKNDRPASAYVRSVAPVTVPVPAAAAAAGAKAPASAPAAPAAAEAGALRAIGSGAAPEADVALATRLMAAGWRYEMPQPKSKTAAWDNQKKASTWFAGYWKNANTLKTSAAQPVEADQFAGDKEDVKLDAKGKPPWASGGAPRKPTFVEWLCSSSGGVEPAAADAPVSAP